MLPRRREELPGPVRRLTSLPVARIAEIHGGRLIAGAQIQRLLPAPGPLIVGPWSSEVGFELLYWVPFLRGLREAGLVDPSRTVAISRGGVSDWYADVADHYVDLHELFPEERVLELALSQRRGRKQLSGLPAFDRKALRLAAARLDLPPSTRTLHPWLMYRRFRPAWVERTPPERVLQELVFRPLPRPDDAVAGRLPARYVAVKPYSSGLLPETGLGQEAFDRMIRWLAERIPVVLLRLGTQLDDHAELDPPEGPGIIDLAGTIPIERNLATQAAVIAGSELFVSPYGGLSYLAVLLGVSAVGLYEHEKFNLVHQRATRAMIDSLRDSSEADLTPLSVRQLTRLHDLLSLRSILT